VAFTKVFLLAMVSAKSVSELHTLSVIDVYMHWNSDGTGLTLWPNPSFFPKRSPPAHFNQIIELAAYDPSYLQGKEASSVELLCPVMALRNSIQATAGFCHFDALFVCQRQRLSRWIVDVIEEAYRSRGLPLPLNIKAHSTERVSTSWAALRGVSLSEICAAATWAASCIFACFYRLNVAAPHTVAAAVFRNPQAIPGKVDAVFIVTMLIIVIQCQGGRMKYKSYI